MSLPEARISELRVAEFYAAVRSLRSCALDLLSRASSNGHSASDTVAPAVARLQSVANQLGTVETLLKPDSATGATAQPSERSLNGGAPFRDGEGPPQSREAATVLALAATVVQLSSSAVDEAERWLRVLRLHGRVGAALESLGVAAYPLPTIADEPRAARFTVAGVETVSELASQFASLHGSRTLDTVHVLFAVLAVHGTRFDRALYAHGTTRQQLLDRLAAGVSLPS